MTSIEKTMAIHTTNSFSSKIKFKKAAFIQRKGAIFSARIVTYTQTTKQPV